MGSRGLSSSKSSGKTPTKWELTRKNAKDYKINIKKRSTSKVTKEEYKKALGNLDATLATINDLNTKLGLSPEFAPGIEMEYGGFKSWLVGGDANIITVGDQDAKVRLFVTALKDGDFTAGAHEYTHALEAWWINNNYNAFMDKVNAWYGANYFNGSEISFAICENAAIRIGELKTNQTMSEDLWKRLAGTIKVNGNYAQSNTSETLATAVEDVLKNGSNASKYSQAIFTELKSTVQETQRRLKRGKPKSANKKKKA